MSKGYHLLSINKYGIYSPFKLHEESLEFVDAIAQGNKIMASVELSDLYGAMRIQANSLGLTMRDLEIMCDATERAFKNNRRESYSLYEYLLNSHDNILEFGLGFIQVKVGDVNYNFYSNKVESFEDADSPHSHQQDFISEILFGQLKEIVYNFHSGEKEMFCGCGEVGKTTKGDFSVKDSFLYSKGDLYIREKEDYHTVSPVTDCVVTRATKIGNKVDAFVFGTKKEYKTKLNTEDMWDIVKEVCEKYDL